MANTAAPPQQEKGRPLCCPTPSHSGRRRRRETRQGESADVYDQETTNNNPRGSALVGQCLRGSATICAAGRLDQTAPRNSSEQERLGLAFPQVRGDLIGRADRLSNLRPLGRRLILCCVALPSVNKPSGLRNRVEELLLGLADIGPRMRTSALVNVQAVRSPPPTPPASRCTPPPVGRSFTGLPSRGCPRNRGQRGRGRSGTCGRASETR
jgi:hypothetical protein